MAETYPVNICGRVEQLPILKLPDGASIAFFNLHGNQSLTEYCAKLLTDIVKGADVVITAESKGLQLAHCIARNLGHDFYAVARKTLKLYMQDGINVDIKSITTFEIQKLYLSAHDTALLKGKKVAIVDDVISTGGSLKGLEDLVNKAGGEIFIKACVLAEGDAAKRDDIKFLQHIPIL